MASLLHGNDLILLDILAWHSDDANTVPAISCNEQGMEMGWHRTESIWSIKVHFISRIFAGCVFDIGLLLPCVMSCSENNLFACCPIKSDNTTHVYNQAIHMYNSLCKEKNTRVQEMNFYWSNAFCLMSAYFHSLFVTGNSLVILKFYSSTENVECSKWSGVEE